MSLDEREAVQTGHARASLPALFSVGRTEDPDETILVLHGELDRWTQRMFSSALAEVGSDVERLVLDLSDLRFIEAAGIGIISHHRALIEQHGGRLELRAAGRRLRKILKRAGMTADRDRNC